MQIDVSHNGEEATASLEGGRVFLRRRNRWTQTEVMNRAAGDVVFVDDRRMTVGESVVEASNPADLAAFRAAVGAVPTPPRPGALPSALTTALSPTGERWQYAVVDIGMFHAAKRMVTVLGEAGAVGWELVTIYDKSSNWFTAMEKGFLLLRRRVPEGVDPGEWAVEYRG